MTRILAFVIAAWLMTPTTLTAGVPSCDNEIVKEALLDAAGGWYLMHTPKDLDASRADTRWCEAPIVLRPPSGRYVVVTYTVEWVNEAQGRFWVQTREMYGCEYKGTWNTCFVPD